MSNIDKMEIDGSITKVIKGAKYEVTLENNHKVMCTVAGKLRMHKINLVLGDNVTVAISPYDLTKGIIIWRNK